MNTLRTLAMGVAAAWSIACAPMRQPSPDYGIAAGSEAASIERGRYLVHGPAHCASCHGDPTQDLALRQGLEIPLSGGRPFALGPLGVLTAPNITSDRAAGIGAMSDDALVRSLRYGISREGRALAPFMAFSGLSDADLRAILSYLRTLPPVATPAPRNDLNWLGAFGLRFMLKPQGPAEPPPAAMEAAADIEYGRYLAHSVANCHGCHTPRNPLTGAFSGADFSGGLVMKEPTGTFVTPDLTPANNGIMDFLSENDFIERFRIDGRGLHGSPMPWAAYARMTDLELKAIYRYLRSLPPAES